MSSDNLSDLSNLSKLIGKKINEKLGILDGKNFVNVEIKSSRTINTNNIYCLYLKFDSLLERIFFENYLIYNLYGRNYSNLIEDQDKKIIDVTKSESYSNNETLKEMRIYNQIAFELFLHHFKITYDDIKCKLPLMINVPMISITTINNNTYPVFILTNIKINDNDSDSLKFKKSTQIKLLQKYYKNIFGSDDLTDSANTDSSDANYEEFYNFNIETNDDIVSKLQNLKTSYIKIYVVFHPFYDMKQYHSQGNTYEKMFVKVNKNLAGQDIMNKLLKDQIIPIISEEEKLLLKKNLDKMFDVSEKRDYESFECNSSE